jgi:hypothetical protein
VNNVSQGQLRPGLQRLLAQIKYPLNKAERRAVAQKLLKKQNAYQNATDVPRTWRTRRPQLHQKVVREHIVEESDQCQAVTRPMARQKIPMENQVQWLNPSVKTGWERDPLAGRPSKKPKPVTLFYPS